MKSFQLSSKAPKELSGETKKCPECLADIPKEAKKCSHCGTQQKQHTSIGKLFLIICVMGIGMSVFLAMGDTSSTSSSSPDIVITENKAKIIAEGYVETILKSPSTAEFPLRPTNYVQLAGNQYKVSSYVDSQNGFGATVRSTWEATITHNGGDWSAPANWTLNELVFDGEVVYSE